MTVGGGSCCRGRRRRPGLGLGLDPRPLLLHTALTAALLLLMGLPGAEGLRWGKKGGGRKQDAASCPAPQPTPLASSSSIPSTPKSAQPLTYAEDWLVPLLPLPLEAPEDPVTLPPGPFSAARVLSFAPRKGASSSSRASSAAAAAPVVHLLALAREGDNDNDNDKGQKGEGEGGAVLHIYDMHGALLAAYPTGHAAPVTCIVFEAGAGGGGDAPLLLLTGARDGSVHLHEAVLWRHGAVIAGGGGGGRRGATSPAASGPAAWGLDGYGVELRLSRRLQGKGSAEVLSGLLNHYQQRQQLGWVAATGDAGGRLRFHAPNGTLVKELDTGGGPVRGLARHGAKHLAVAAGPDVRFLSPATLQEPAHGAPVCLGRHGHLTALAVDPALPFLLYAGTADGDVLAFDSRGTAAAGVAVAAAGVAAGQGKTGQQRQLALAFKLGHPRHGGPNAPVSLTAIRGYLLVATASGLYAYNTTSFRFSGSGSAPPPLVFHLPFFRGTSGGGSSSSISSTSAAPLILAASATPAVAGPRPGASGKPPPVPPTVLLLQGPDGRLRAWESLLPYARPQPIDLFWVRIPLMLVALGLVLMWQWQKQGHRQTAALLGSGGMGKRRGGGLFGGAGAGAGGRRRGRGRYRGEGQRYGVIDEGVEGEEDDDDGGEEEDPTRGIGLRPPGRRGYEVAGEAFGEGQEEEELTFMRRALQEVRRGGGGLEEAEMEEVLRRERARIERWR